VTLRGRLILYLAAVHLLLVVVAAFVVRRDRLWLPLVELAFVASLAVGVGLVRRLTGALGLVRDSAQYLVERDYTTRVRETGQKDLDSLIVVYNRMVDTLREERLRLQEQHYLLGEIVAASPSGFVTLDFEGRIDLVNPRAEALLALSATEIRGKRPVEAAGPLGQVLEALAEGETRIVALRGGRRVRCHRGAFRDRGFARTFFLLDELTDELRLYEKATYEKLIRMMSHEVNNSVGASNSLLHSCLNYARHLPPDDRTDFENALAIVIARTDTLAVFMRSFAEVVRLPPPQRAPCDLRVLVEDVARLMRPLATERGVRLETELPEGAAVAALDRVQMEQAIVNVVKNAIEAAGAGGRASLCLTASNGAVRIRVEDTGPGLSAEARANLFAPFFTTKPHGQGIGLTLVQEVLRQHGFAFSLDGPAGGPTRFTVELPYTALGGSQ
jgi:signal transduction histidine kinase